MMKWIRALPLLALLACRDATGTQPAATSEAKPAAGSAAAAPVPANPAAPSDLTKGDQQDNEWVPAEYKQGAARWKDTGVYLDGKPVGFLTFGELPIALKPTWVKDKVSTNKPANCPQCPAWKWAQQRFYKFTDYLRAIGVDIRKIKEMHVYGPRLSQSIVVTGRELQSKRADGFMFRFGGDVTGKALPWTPEGFGNGKTPDKIAGVMIYIERKPPTVTRDGIELDGQPNTGVPYYGDPVRGGVRVYLDDKLATIVKRQELDPKRATKTASGELAWSFGELLQSKGVDSSKLVEGWLICDEKRAERIPWSELQHMMFTAGLRAKGGILLGDKGLRASVIALHTRTLNEAELPVILPEEAW